MLLPSFLDFDRRGLSCLSCFDASMLLCVVVRTYLAQSAISYLLRDDFRLFYAICAVLCLFKLTSLYKVFSDFVRDLRMQKDEKARDRFRYLRV